MTINVLLHTTIEHTTSDWHIGRFSVLRDDLGSRAARQTAASRFASPRGIGAGRAGQNAARRAPVQMAAKLVKNGPTDLLKLTWAINSRRRGSST